MIIIIMIILTILLLIIIITLGYRLQLGHRLNQLILLLLGIRYYYITFITHITLYSMSYYYIIILYIII